MKIAALAIRFAWATKGKFLLLSLLVAVGMSVLLVVTELSRVSTLGLEDAIAEDVGRTGTYAVGLSTDLGLAPSTLADRVAEAVGPFATEPPVMIEALPTIQAECPPFQALGAQPILVLRDMTTRPIDLPFGEGLPPETRICLDGHEIPATSLYLPTRSEQRTWATGLFIQASYADVVKLSSTTPVTYSFTVITGESTDERDALTNAVTAALRTDADRYGIDAATLVSVYRADQGAGIRSASEGVALVYTVIAWGVLFLAGLGLLVAELIVVRQRMWFFGLARAVGARSVHIAGLVLADVLLVLVVGASLAVVTLTIAQPTVAHFARDAFAVDATLVQPSSIPRLLAGVLAVLLVAGAYPAVRATRQDPVDVLEPKGS